jgi:hypothetical protein
MLSRLFASSKLVALIGVGLGVSLTACMSSPTGDDGTTAVPRISTNSLMPSQLFNGQLTTDQLTATSAAAMASSDDARATLGYAVGCALDASQSITFTVGGTAYTEAGSIGLATDWTSGALSATEAAWVSACVFSRVNLEGVSVTISDRGSASALAVTADEAQNWTLEEGAFWGNAFVDLGDMAGFACMGVDQAADDTQGDLPERRCAQPSAGDASTSPCGFHYAGSCSAVCAAGSPYAGCAFASDAAASAVVTTFLN